MRKKILLLGSGELGKEVVIALQRLGAHVIAVDSYENAPAMQVAHDFEVINMLDGDQLDTVPGWYNGEHSVTDCDTALTVATGNGTELNFAQGSIVVDPWRKTPEIDGVEVIHYGNTRQK